MTTVALLDAQEAAYFEREWAEEVAEFRAAHPEVTVQQGLNVIQLRLKMDLGWAVGNYGTFLEDYDAALPLVREALGI